MNVGGKLTDGGDLGTTGGTGFGQFWRDPRWIAAITFLAFGFVYMLVNAASLIDQRRALGRPIATWHAWALESSSYAAWLLLLPFVLLISARLAKRKLWCAVAGHFVACILISLAHSGAMFVIRAVIFLWAGMEYTLSDTFGGYLAFEFRKDVITYVSILAVFLIARHITVTSELARSSFDKSDGQIEVRDGSRVVMLRTDEIDWIGAAGNYVELHGPFGSVLARRTLADFSQELEPRGFVRVHRSRLVRRSAIATITTRQSGDFDIQLRSGESIVGSRRFRQGLG